MASFALSVSRLQARTQPARDLREGRESSKVRKTLIELNCQALQGHLQGRNVGRPRGSRDFEKKMPERSRGCPSQTGAMR